MNKKRLRLQMKSIRAHLSLKRKDEAKTALFKTLFPRVKTCGYVLSFFSVFDEICLNHLNQYLCENGQLLLPNLKGEIYRVDQLSNMLRNEKNFLEPNSFLCEKVPLDIIDFALIPGLAFDLNHNRLGYGKGIYDQLLLKLQLHSVGVGFKEQLVDSVPVDSHDQKLSDILLF